MALFYTICADLIVTVHFGFVAFVLVGQLLILLGIVRKWGWIRNFTFRTLHLTAIVIVVAEALGGLMCPLTTWEQQLRTAAGATTYTGDFIPRLLHDLMFFNAEPWVFTLSYCIFGVLVLATFILAPPRNPWRKKDAAAAPSAEAPREKADAHR